MQIVIMLHKNQINYFSLQMWCFELVLQNLYLNKEMVKSLIVSALYR